MTNTVLGKIRRVVAIVEPDSESQPAIDVKHCIGVRGDGNDWAVSDDYVNTLYDRELSLLREANPTAFVPHSQFHPCVSNKIRWRDCYVDDTLAPSSSEQARNPDWENYVWNSNDVFGRVLESR